MHKRLMDPVLAALDTERCAYFTDITQTLSEDSRIADNANLVFLFLAVSAPYLPTKLPKDTFITALLAFVTDHEKRLRRTVFDPAFISDHGHIKPIVSLFVMETVTRVLELFDNGEIGENGTTAEYRLGWPIEPSAFPYFDPDDNDDDDD